MSALIGSGSELSGKSVAMCQQATLIRTAHLYWSPMASARSEGAAEPPAKGGGRENRHQQRRQVEDRDIGLAGIADTAGDCGAPDAMHHGDHRQRHRGDDTAEAAGCSRGPERPREHQEIEPDPDLV